MAVQVSDALRKKLQSQRGEMSHSIIIANKGITKIRLRILPRVNEVPGTKYASMYGPQLAGERKGSASPETWGVACPVVDAYKGIMRTGSKADKEFLKAHARLSTEYWMAVMERDDMGTAEKPNIRIFCAKTSVYQYIIDFILDEDDGGYLTDLIGGRDLRVKKTGTGLDTEWTSRALEIEPVSEDSDFVEAIRAANAAFDVSEYFYKINLDVMRELYETLTGNAVPDEYLDSIHANCPVYNEDESKSDERPSRPSTTVQEEPDPVADDDDALELTVTIEDTDYEIVPESTIVTFDGGNGAVTGLVLSLIKDEDGEIGMKVEDENDPDEPWTIFANSVTAVEYVEADAEPEEVAPTEEPEEPKAPVKKAPVKKGPAKKGPAKKGAPSKPAKPSAKKGGASKTGNIKDRLKKGGKRK